ncbi:MAG: flavin reductase family protein [Chitinispirillaceae bacterium]|nr:flavin reductase family protein [Chitinispirillaceae bacterium]
MGKKTFPLAGVYRLLECGPVVLVTTSRKNRPNVMAMAWHTMMDFAPPLLGCVIDAKSLTFGTLRKTKECVINIPSVDLAAQVVSCGSTSGRDIDKFRTFGLTPLPASRVAAPLIDECWAGIECRLADARMAAKYNFFVLEALAAWVDPRVKSPKTIHHLGKGKFMVAGRTFTPPASVK